MTSEISLKGIEKLIRWVKLTFIPWSKKTGNLTRGPLMRVLFYSGDLMPNFKTVKEASDVRNRLIKLKSRIKYAFCIEVKWVHELVTRD